MIQLCMCIINCKYRLSAVVFPRLPSHLSAKINFKLLSYMPACTVCLIISVTDFEWCHISACWRKNVNLTHVHLRSIFYFAYVGQIILVVILDVFTPRYLITK